MSNRFKTYALAVAERAVKTTAQTAVALITADEGLSLIEVDWLGTLGIAATAGVLSVLTSIGSNGFGGDSGPSLGPEKLDPS